MINLYFLPFDLDFLDLDLDLDFLDLDFLDLVLVLPPVVLFVIK